MPFFLKKRQQHLVELMDLEDCNEDILFNTYRQFKTINALLTNWRHIYTSILRPKMNDSSKQYSLLDIGFGGGDIPLSISKWAEKDGINLSITAIETDERALKYVSSYPNQPSISFNHISSTELIKQNLQFDFVISNHMLHHLSEDSFFEMLAESKQLAKIAVVFSDIRRSDIGLVLYYLFTKPFFHQSFIVHDGLISIKRSFTSSELTSLIKDTSWNVNTSFPFRLLLTWAKDD